MSKKHWLALALVMFASCTVTAAALGMPPVLDARAQCPNLEERLWQLTQDENPSDYAARHGIFYNQEGWVRVVIELRLNTESMPEGYAMEIELQHEGLIQIMVRWLDLCALSNEPQVDYVRVPAAVLIDPIGKPHDGTDDDRLDRRVHRDEVICAVPQLPFWRSPCSEKQEDLSLIGLRREPKRA